MYGNNVRAIILKEQPHKIHRQKLDDLLKEAELIAKEYIIRKFPDLWPKLQKNFIKQAEFNKLRKEFEKNNIIDIEMKHLDLTNFLQLLQNGVDSPLCVKSPKPPSLYAKTWINPNDDMKTKLKDLQAKFRANCSSKMSEDELIKNDIQKIITESKNVGDINFNVSSYSWLLNEDRPSESLLSADNVKFRLSALMLVYGEFFDPIDYAYVNCLSILHNKRNSISHTVGEEFIPLADYNRDYHIIHQCVQNLFRLISVVCNGDAAKLREFEEFRCISERRIDIILSRTMFDAENTIMFQQSDDPVSAFQFIQENVDKVNVQSSSVTKKISNSSNDDSQKRSSTSVDKNDGTFCKICNISVTNHSEMRAHEQGAAHQKKLKQVNWNASPQITVTPSRSNCSQQEGVSSPTDEQRSCAVRLTMSAFVDSFDTTRPCAILRGIGVLSPHDSDQIRSQPSREDRVVEFLEVIQQKLDWYKHLKSVLVPNYANLLEQLEGTLHRITAGN